jgi:DNA repair exonuclease SbcCD ATPase subunit
MCVHNNGIPFELVKRTLPLLNEEMNSLLVGIVGFKAFFEDEDGKLEIYIQHPGHGQRAIENCSGSEKSLVSMAIRMALIKCGSLPTSDIFILDEPATALDSKHMDSFIKILEMIKSQFKIVLLITHLEVLKDSVDKIIEIQKDDEGYAYIN